MFIKLPGTTMKCMSAGHGWFATVTPKSWNAFTLIARERCSKPPGYGSSRSSWSAKSLHSAEQSASQLGSLPCSSVWHTTLQEAVYNNLAEDKCTEGDRKKPSPKAFKINLDIWKMQAQDCSSRKRCTTKGATSYERDRIAVIQRKSLEICSCLQSDETEWPQPDTPYPV